jgi:hypothetical protein
MSPDKHVQRSETHKVPGRVRGHAVRGHVTSARVLKDQRAVADAGRYAKDQELRTMAGGASLSGLCRASVAQVSLTCGRKG